MPDVIMYDETNAWSPELVKSGRDGTGCGGWECYQVQIATWLAKRGLEVQVQNASGSFNVDSFGCFWPSRQNFSCHALITGRHSPLPALVKREVTVTSVVDDPRYEKSHDHLKGISLLICISDWQALLFRELGHDAYTIHSVLDDGYYDPDYPHRDWSSSDPPARRFPFVCVNAWNKGTDLTLHAWRSLRARYPGWQASLAVGSPYSEPPDAAARCEAAGATWLGRLKPHEVVDTLRQAEAVFRVCNAPETFGVTDAIAEAVGCRVHCLCTNGLGAAPEALVSPYLTESLSEFERGCLLPLEDYPAPKDWRMSTVMPKWLPVLGLG